MKLHHCAWACFAVLMSCSGSSSTSSGGTTTPATTTTATAGDTTTAATTTPPATTTPETTPATTPATTTPETTPATTTPATTTPAAPAVAWATMTHEQKLDYMQHTVMPEMTRMFQEFDGHRFEHFTCGTCHGANARAVNFHMPNGIAPLDPARIPAMFASQDRMPVFMTQHVWPRMTELLGAQRYNPETHQGFGCFGCHGMRTGAAAPAAHPATAPAAHPAAH
jgi:hypothetical protein